MIDELGLTLAWDNCFVVPAHIEVIMLLHQRMEGPIIIFSLRGISQSCRSWLRRNFDSILLIFEHAAKRRLNGISYTFQSGVHSFCIALGSAWLFNHRLIDLIALFLAKCFTVHTYGILFNILINLMVHLIMSLKYFNIKSYNQLDG